MRDNEDSSAPPTLQALPAPRALTRVERAWLDHLVAPLQLWELVEQTAAAEVTAECACGCPSIGLGGAGPDVPPDVIERLSESGRDDYLSRTASVKSSKGQDVEVTLHVANGRLVELEVWVSQNPSNAVNTELPPPPSEASTFARSAHRR